MALKTGSKTKTGAKAAKPGPKGKRATGNKIGAAAALTRAFLGPNPPKVLNHLPREDPPLGDIIRERHGRMPLITDPAELMAIAQEYFEWSERNPMWEDKLVTFQGMASHEPVPKMRLRSIGMLCFFLGINHTTWYLWRKTRDDLKDTIAAIEQRIEEENKAGASAELMNANFVARVLGLADRQEHTGKDGGPIASSSADIDISKLTDEELEAYRVAAAALERVRSGN